MAARSFLVGILPPGLQNRGNSKSQGKGITISTSSSSSSSSSSSAAAAAAAPAALSPLSLKRIFFNQKFTPAYPLARPALTYSERAPAGTGIGAIRARTGSESTASSRASTTATGATHDGDVEVTSPLSSIASPLSAVSQLQDPSLWEKLEAEGRRELVLPDLFSSIMAVECPVSPHYEAVRLISEEFIKKCWNLTGKDLATNHILNVAAIVSRWAPLGDEESLVVLANFTNWLFYYDDQFDEGKFKTDPEAAAVEVNRTLRLLKEDTPVCSPEENPHDYVLQDCVIRFRKRTAGTDLEQRFIKSIEGYLGGVLRQVHLHATNTIISVEEYMTLRRTVGGIYPCYAGVEYCHGIKLPQYVIDHRSIAICEEVANDMTILHNDMISYKKDIRNNFPYNVMIILSQLEGLGEQQAVDRIEGMLTECTRRWYRALVDLPSWGEEIDRDVLLYLDACRNLALGSLHWSFHSGRYFGEDMAKIRATRIINLP